jgi:hypothetical protein
MSITSTMRVLAGRKLIRSGLAAAAIALSGCALDPQGGYSPVTQLSGSPERSVSFDEANARCWTVSMNIAGYSATAAQSEAYRTCMVRNGWENRRSLF